VRLQKGTDTAEDSSGGKDASGINDQGANDLILIALFYDCQNTMEIFHCLV
jgi:hypothetical protein